MSIQICTAVLCCFPANPLMQGKLKVWSTETSSSICGFLKYCFCYSDVSATSCNILLKNLGNYWSCENKNSRKQTLSRFISLLWFERATIDKERQQLGTIINNSSYFNESAVSINHWRTQFKISLIEIIFIWTNYYIINVLCRYNSLLKMFLCKCFMDFHHLLANLWKHFIKSMPLK